MLQRAAQSKSPGVREMPARRSLLLYADDPGAANYLAPLPAALSAAGFLVEFLVAPALARYAADRHIACKVRNETSPPEALLARSDGLVIGTSEDPRCFGHSLIATARRMGIPSLAVIDMEVNAAGRFRGESEDPLLHAPDFLAVPDSSCRDAYAKLGFPESRMMVCGHPHYDLVRARREELLTQDRRVIRQAVFPQAPTDRPIWLFLAEAIDQLNPAISYRSPDYTLSGRGGSDFRTAIVLEEVLDAAAVFYPKPYVVLRLHPKNLPEDFTAYANELGETSETGDPLPLVWAADLVIGMTTMLLLETYLLRRPHLAVLPRAVERNWLVTTATGLTPVASTRDELHYLVQTLSQSTEITPHPDENSVLPRNAVSILVERLRKELVLLS